MMSTGPNVPEQVLLVRAERTANTLETSFVLNGSEHHASLRSSEKIGPEADSLLLLALLPAMRARSILRLTQPVSPQLLKATDMIQDIWRAWDERYGRVSIDVEARETGLVERAPGVGCFFSGGMDSFYTLLKHREEITHLIFVHGFDIPLEDAALRQKASQAAHEVANDLGKNLIEVETNYNRFRRGIGVGWTTFFGSALAAVALLFQHRLGRILIASGRTYADLNPRGSHPLLDPLWSTERTVFEHDGAEATREEKAAFISQYPAAMKYLRVCFQNQAAYNCGHCDKCLRTMINLRTVGALERCETLPSDLELEAVAGMKIKNETGRMYSRESLAALERLGTEPALAQAIAKSIVNSLDAEGPRREEALMRQLEAARTKLAVQSERISMLKSKLQASRKQRRRGNQEKSRRRAQDADSPFPDK